MSLLFKFRERVNLKLFKSKGKALALFRYLNIIVSAVAIGAIIYYYGFPQDKFTENIVLRIIQASFTFYVLKFFTKIIYDFHPLSYIKKNWLETLTVLFLIVEGANYFFFNELLMSRLFERFGFGSFKGVSIFFVQFYFLFLLFVELRRESSLLPRFKVHPAMLFMGSIATLTLGGAALLCMPEMMLNGGVPLVDALFMSISSTSVTGLATLDLANDFTFKGQVVVLVLIKLGGLNTIAFGALLVVMAKFGVGIKHHEIIEDFVNKDSITEAKSMFSKIVLWSVGIELMGIILLYVAFGNQGMFADNGERLFQAIFHGISGFNNAGLSTFEGGMMHPDVNGNFLVHIIILGLFFLGGFGMIYLFDLFSINNLRERMRRPWKTIGFGTKISLYFTLILLLIGAIGFVIFEYDNTLKGSDNIMAKFVTAMYQSMTTRNAGFNLVETASLATPTLIIFLFLMFIGASSGSAGGGIRTSTFAIMWASVISTIRGKKNIELFKRNISNELVLKSYAVFLFFVVGNVVGPLVLSISEAEALNAGHFTFMDLVFEHVSAASTVGLSTGITADLSTVGKYTLIVAMFIGRVGTLTLAYLFSKQVISTNYKYPAGHTMVG